MPLMHTHMHTLTHTPLAHMLVHMLAHTLAHTRTYKHHVHVLMHICHFPNKTVFTFMCLTITSVSETARQSRGQYYELFLL